MKKPYFLIQSSDQLILSCLWYDDPNAGPAKPVPPTVEGTVLVDTHLALEFTRAGRRDTEAAYWLNGAVEWVETATLAEARALAWSDVKKSRDQAEAAPFEFEGNLYDPNKENVAGAALAALMAKLSGVEVSRTWTLADNTRQVLTGPQLIALGLALTERVDAIHERGRTLRDLINNAATPAEAYSYTWDTNDE